MNFRLKRGIALGFVLIGLAITMLLAAPPAPDPSEVAGQEVGLESTHTRVPLARESLQKLAVKGRAPLTGYSRAQFGNGWRSVQGCDMRETILYRDLRDTVTNERCQVVSGVLNDPYTGKMIQFTRGVNSAAIQIDHVVALSNAWQTGAQQLTQAEREDLANDPLELLAVDGPANQQKSDGDAATWLPANKAFRCSYVARQIAVKAAYRLWVTPAEYDAIERVLLTCPEQRLPTK